MAYSQYSKVRDYGETSLSEIINTIFKDKSSQNRILVELERINNLDRNIYQVSAEKASLGLIFTVSIVDKEQQLLPGESIEFQLLIEKDYPFKPPKLFCKSAVGYPALNDCRDILEDVIEKEYDVSTSSDSIIRKLREFVKVLDRKKKDLMGFIMFGEYWVDEQYDMELFAGTNTFSIAEAYKYDRNLSKDIKIFLILTDLCLLEFQQYGSNEMVARLRNWIFLSTIEQLKLTKDKRGQDSLTISIKDNDRIENYVYVVVDPQPFTQSIQKSQKLLVDRLNQVSKSKSIKEDEVTLKFYKDMDIQQILENIALCETQFLQEKSLSLVETLQILYQKAIEYLSAIGDESFLIFIDKMKDLLSREDVQILLQLHEDQKKLAPHNQKQRKQQRKHQTLSNEKKQEQTVAPQQNLDLLDFEEFQFLPQENQESVFDEIQIQQQLLSQFQPKFHFNYSLPKLDTDKKRYLFVREDHLLQRVRRQYYYDKQEKKCLVRVTYQKRLLHLTKNDQSILQEHYDPKRFLEVVAAGNKTLDQVILDSGACPLLQWCSKRELTEEQFQSILDKVLHLLRFLHTNGLFIYNWSPAVFQLVYLSYRNYDVRINPVLCLAKQGEQAREHLRFGAPKYHSREWLTQLKEGGAQAVREGWLKESIYGLGVYLRECLQASSSHGEDWSKFKAVAGTCQNFEELFEGLSEHEPSSLADPQGLAQKIWENSFREKLQEEVLQEISGNEGFAERRGYGARQRYVLKMVDSGLQLPPVHPLFFHQKTPGLEEFLELPEVCENERACRVLDDILNEKQTDLRATFGQLDELALPEDLTCLFAIYSVLLLRCTGYGARSLELAEYLVELFGGARGSLLASDVLALHAYTLNYYGDHRDALKLYERSLEIRLSWYPPESAQVFSLKLQQAQILVQLGHEGDAQRILGGLEAGWQKLEQEDELSLGLYSLYDLKAVLHLQNKQVQQALDYAQRAQVERKNVHGENSLQHVFSWFLILRIHMYLSDLDSVQKTINSLRIHLGEVLQGKEHTLLADLHDRQGELDFQRRQYSESLKSQTQCLEIRKRILYEDHPQISECYLQLGKVLIQQQKYAEAKVQIEKGLDIRRIRLGVRHQSLISCVDLLIQVCLALGHVEQLQDIFLAFEDLYRKNPAQQKRFQEKKVEVYTKFGLQKELVEIEYQTLVEELKGQEKSSLHIAQKIINLGIKLHQFEKYEESVQLKTKSLDLVQELLGKLNPKIIQIRISIADSLIKLARFEEAFEQEKLALKLYKELGSDQSEITKFINSMGSLCKKLIQANEMDRAFLLNDQISAAIIEIFGQNSPYLEIQSMMMQQHFNSIMQ